jgi:NAD(P)-dependent dehydrogenase (short-subunit alcohol dehydrogenase family)
MNDSMNPFSLQGKVSLVTGGSRGLGLGYARALARAGSDLIILGRGEDALAEASRTISEETGRKVLIYAGDVSSEDTQNNMLQKALEVFGGIDILINNAGANCRKPFLEIQPEEFDLVMDVNVKAVYFLTQKVVQLMLERGQGGKIINIASLTSVMGIQSLSVYGSSKGGVLALTKALALELAPHKINVNAIAPGYFRTDFTEAAFQIPERAAWINSRIPLGHYGKPDEIANLAVFLSSSAADYMTGNVIFADGGWTSA